MKKLILILSLALFSCEAGSGCKMSNRQQFIVHNFDQYGNRNVITCDSFEMITNRQAIIWSDSTRVVLFSNDRLSAESNSCYELKK